MIGNASAAGWPLEVSPTMAPHTSATNVDTSATAATDLGNRRRHATGTVRTTEKARNNGPFRPSAELTKTRISMTKSPPASSASATNGWPRSHRLNRRM